MTFIEQLPLIGPLLANLLPFLVVLGIVVGVHEYGHYIVAKWCGVYSEVFSIGFGPELYGWYDRHGTRWKLAAIPLGGYVRFRGSPSFPDSPPKNTAFKDMDAATEKAFDSLARAEGNGTARVRGGIAAPAKALPSFRLSDPGVPVREVAGFDKSDLAIYDGIAAREAGLLNTLHDRASSFPYAAVWKRAAIAFAGPLANFILTTLLFAGIAIFAGVVSDRPVIGAVTDKTEGARAGFEVGDVVRSVNGEEVTSFLGFSREIIDAPGVAHDVEIERDGEVMVLPFTYAPRIVLDNVVTGSAADEAGIEVGDVIVALNDEPLTRFRVLVDHVSETGGVPVKLTLEREGEALDISLTPRRTERRNAEGEVEDRFLIGIGYELQYGLDSALEPLGPLDALQYGVVRTGNIIGGTVLFLYDLINGRSDGGELGGPIRIAEYSGEAASQGFMALIALTAALSASIGLLNLFPVPVLDGGHLLFYAIEALRGKPLNQRMQEFALTIGLAMILTLMVYATWNDIARWF